MTEPIEPHHDLASEGDENLPAIQEVAVVGSVDWFLQETIEVIISRGVQIGVTLTVGGSIISGMLISGRTYFSELADSVGKGFGPDDFGTQLADMWRKNMELYSPPEAEGDDWQQPNAGFVHLRNAKYYLPGAHHSIPSSGSLWRGKLSSIDGFIIGNFGNREDGEDE